VVVVLTILLELRLAPLAEQAVEAQVDQAIHPMSLQQTQQQIQAAVVVVVDGKHQVQHQVAQVALVLLLFDMQILTPPPRPLQAHQLLPLQAVTAYTNGLLRVQLLSKEIT
jgi:hypothetical protein